MQVRGLSALIVAILVFSSAVDAQQCEFKCPKGQIRKDRPSHTPSSNGCGTGGFKVTETFGLSKCCDKHDICYDTCGADKDKCDRKFSRCMEKVCAGHPSQQQSCRSQATIMHIGTSSLGCQPFLDSQANACECSAPDQDEKSDEL